MIGQRELLGKIDAQIERGKFPKVSILVGEQGSGRKTLANHIAQKMGVMMALVGPTLDEIAEIHNVIYNDISVVCIFQNFESIPNKAMGIFKLMIEDMPDDVYFIISCENLDEIPIEIKSRAVTYIMDSYSDDDKNDWMYENDIEGLSEEEIEFILDVASNLGEVKRLCSMNIASFSKFVNETMDGILDNTQNTHEIASKIDFYGGDALFPFRLFLRAFTAICGDRTQTEDNPLLYCRMIAITGDALQEIAGVDSDYKAIFESWLEQIREEIDNLGN